MIVSDLDKHTTDKENMRQGICVLQMPCLRCAPMIYVRHEQKFCCFADASAHKKVLLKMRHGVVLNICLKH